MLSEDRVLDWRWASVMTEVDLEISSEDINVRISVVREGYASFECEVMFIYKHYIQSATTLTSRAAGFNSV